MVMQQTPLRFKRIELKFLLTPELSSAIQDWSLNNMDADEFCRLSGQNHYDINTLYLDTPQHDLLHKTGVVGRTKHRIRRYGNDDQVWLETKRKKKMVVRKNRTAIPDLQLAEKLSLCDQIQDALPIQTDWQGDWFRKRVCDRSLEPAVQISYRRFARSAGPDQNSARLTIDSQMKARPSNGWTVTSAADDDQVEWEQISSREVLELKFHDVMPELFKNLLREFVIPATGFSKYRLAMLKQQTSPKVDSQAELLQYA